MKKGLQILGGVVLFVLLLLFSLRLYFTPSYNGKEEISGLNKPTEIVFDGYGIPHIYADQAEDAYHTLGWVHAKERLWQMDLLRRAASGRLSAAFGEEFVMADKFMLNLGIAENTEQSIAGLSGNEDWLKLARAYLNGINAYIESEKAPLEYVLAGIEREPFELRDIYNSLGYMAFTFAHAQGVDPLLTHIADSLGKGYLEDLAIETLPGSERIPTFKPSEAAGWDMAFRQLADEVRVIPSIPFTGSNSWVIGPDRTERGAVILANDPHMKFAQPAVWYESHLSYPGYENYGFYITGIPFPLLHHNRVKANGLTMFVNDDFDFYAIDPDPEDAGRYQGDQGSMPFEKLPYTLAVKGGDSVSFELKRSHLGMVLDREIDSTLSRPMAIHWVFTDKLNELPEVLYQLNYARTLKDFRESLRKLHAPGLNVMYGDSTGNFAWFATAHLFDLDGSPSTKQVLDTHRRVRHAGNQLRFDANPQAINPPSGYVYSANNAPESDSLYIPGYFLPENRAKRIVELLELEDRWNAEKTEEMLLDVFSESDRNLCRFMVGLLNTASLDSDQQGWVKQLAGWDGQYGLDRPEPGFFHQWIYALLRLGMQDELGAKRFESFLETHLFKRSLIPLIENGESIWWDRIDTADQENREELVQLAFLEAWALMREHHGSPAGWSWGDMHTLTHNHPLGTVPVLGRLWNVSAGPVEGSREVINNLMFDYLGEPSFKVKAGPSTRRIVDFSDLDNSRAVLPTGQSGNPFSPFYQDQKHLYTAGEYRPMLIDSTRIRQSRKGFIRLLPSGD